MAEGGGRQKPKKRQSLCGNWVGPMVVELRMLFSNITHLIATRLFAEMCVCVCVRPGDISTSPGV